MLSLSPLPLPRTVHAAVRPKRASGRPGGRLMQAVAEAIREAGGAVLFQGLRAALYERLVGRPLAAVDQSAPALGGAWPSDSVPLGGQGATCPAQAGVACPTVCLGLAVDVSGGVTPLLLASVLALLGATACCSCLGGCCLAGVSARWWGRCLAWVRRAVAAPALEPPRAPPPQALAYGPGPQAADRGAALSARRPAGSGGG